MSKRRDSSIFRRLEYFEATARHGSVARAAAELGVTPSAVSHQLSDLKRTIGEDLFSRSGRGVVLPSAGQRLAERLSTAFGILESSVSSAIGAERASVSIAACSAFGPYWLIPRLQEFNEANPDIDIEIRLYSTDPELTQASADCIISAQEVKSGYASTDLFEERAIAVAPPGMVRGGRINGAPLITTHTEKDELGGDWHYIAEATGAVLPRDPNWIRCSHYILALEAAKAGIGAAIIPDFVAEQAIGEGRLEDLGLGGHRLEDRTYRICYKEIRGNEPALRAVSSWLARTVRDERQDEDE